MLCWDSASTEFYLLNPNDGAIQTFAGHQGNVNDVAFFPNDELIVSGSGDKSVRVWDETNGRFQDERLPTAVRWVRVSPDGRHLVVDLEKELVIFRVNI